MNGLNDCTGMCSEEMIDLFVLDFRMPWLLHYYFKFGFIHHSMGLYWESPNNYCQLKIPSYIFNVMENVN